jgi:hypothetical protein
VVRYLEFLRSVRDQGDRLHKVGDRPGGPAPRTNGAAVVADDTQARMLEHAGYKPKLSFYGKTIWQRPDTGFWVSQEVALHLLEQSTHEEQRK